MPVSQTCDSYNVFYHFPGLGLVKGQRPEGLYFHPGCDIPVLPISSPLDNLFYLLLKCDLLI